MWLADLLVFLAGTGALWELQAVLLPQHGLPSWTMLNLVWWDVQVDHCCVLFPPPYY
jgi:hypothetical protein